MNPLIYVEMKAARAQVHLNVLNQEVGLYLQDAYTVTRKDDVDNSRHICRTEQKAVPPIIGMVLGEFLYCLRSGLDQAAWNLALPDARRDKPRDIYFPIEDRGKRLNTLLGYFPDDVAKEIELLQPYHGPGSLQDHALWQLKLLSNLDKHKVIPLASTSFPIYVPKYNPAVLINEFEYAYEVSVPLADKKDLDFQPQVPPEVEFGDWGSDLRIPRHRLADIHGFITCSVIPKLSRFFSDSPDTPLSRADLVGIVLE